MSCKTIEKKYLPPLLWVSSMAWVVVVASVFHQPQTDAAFFCFACYLLRICRTCIKYWRPLCSLSRTLLSIPWSHLQLDRKRKYPPWGDSAREASRLCRYKVWFGFVKVVNRMQSKKKLTSTTKKWQITNLIAHHLWLTHSSSKNHHSQLRRVLSADCNHHSPLLLHHCLQNMAQILSLQCKGRILPKLGWDASVKRGKLREENYSNRISSYVLMLHGEEWL